MPPQAQLSALACHRAPIFLSGLRVGRQPPAVARSQKAAAIPAMGAPTCPTTGPPLCQELREEPLNVSFTSPWDQMVYSPPPVAPTEQKVQPSPKTSVPLGTCRREGAAGQRQLGHVQKCSLTPAQHSPPPQWPCSMTRSASTALAVKF